MNQISSLIGEISMRTAAERHKRAGETAEASHQFDFAAHEFFEAAKDYRRRGRNRDADEMVAQERRVLAKIITLTDSAADLESQASKLTDYAYQISQKPAEEGPSDTSDLYALVSSLYEEAADRYLVLAEQATEAIQKQEYLQAAANDLRTAGKTRARAAGPGSPDSEEESRALYWRASRLIAQVAQTDLIEGQPAEPSATPQLMLAWLRRGARPKCQECHRLWKAYTQNTQRYASLLKDREGHENADLDQLVASAAEWLKLATNAVLDHEANHEAHPHPLAHGRGMHLVSQAS